MLSEAKSQSKAKTCLRHDASGGKWKIFLLLLIACPRLSLGQPTTEKTNLIISEAEPESVLFGVRNLETALKEKGFEVVRFQSVGEAKDGICFLVGTREINPDIQRLIQQKEMEIPQIAESFAIKVCKLANKNFVVVAGQDPTGTMYGALDLAEQISWMPRGTELIARLEAKALSPWLKIRGTNPFLTSQALADPESWYYSIDYWQGYLDMLARCRYNLLDFHAGYDIISTDFPNIFSYLIYLDEYPEFGVGSEQAKKNLEMFKLIIKMAKARGIKVGLMNYDSRTELVPPGTSKTERTKGGLKGGELAEYTAGCVCKLLQACPDLWMFGFRIGESGQVEDFYKRSYLQGIEEAGRDINLYTRSWGATRSEINEIGRALLGGKLYLEIKYNGEHLGLPYHAITGRAGRDYSYQSYTNYPRNYYIIWQIRANGTHRIFLWGDPEFARRCVRSCKFGDGVGFSMEPITAYFPQKDVYHNTEEVDHSYFQWMWQRNWFWYLIWGRLAYDPDTPNKVWLEEFKTRFGKAGEAIYKAIVQSSKIIPLIYSSHCLSLDHRGMAPEHETGGVLDEFIEVRPLDYTVMQSILEYVDGRLNDIPSGKLTPLEVGELLAKAANQSLESITKAGEELPTPSKEWECIKMDIEALHWLAYYYKEKIEAGVDLQFFYKTGHSPLLDSAREHVENAISYWDNLAEVTNRHYRPLIEKLRMHTEKFSWKTEGEKLVKDLDIIEGAVPLAETQAYIVKTTTDTIKPKIVYEPESIEPPVEEIIVRAKITDNVGVADAWVWSKVMPSDLLWEPEPMEPSGEFWEATVPVSPEGILYYIEAHDVNGNGTIYPDFLDATPYFVVKGWIPD